MAIIGIIGLTLLGAVAAHFIRRRRQWPPLPPSPPADPFIGHLRSLPDRYHVSEAFHDWSLKYGDIFSLRVPGKTIIVLASEKAASDLLDKRSAIYSDRQPFGFYDAIGWGDGAIVTHYGPFLTRQRRLLNDALDKNVVSQYETVQEEEARILLKGLLDEPSNFERLVARYTIGIVSQLTYGHKVDSFDDEYFLMGEKFIEITGDAVTPSLLDVHPLFAYLPSWFPGAWFVKFLKDTKPVTDGVMHDSFRRTVEQMQKGVAPPSFISKHLEAMYGEEHDAEQERAIKLAAGMVFIAGGETTWHAITIFIACMLMYPEVQQRAQEEIDKVVGRDRLPDFGDRESLPYLQCVLKETMRWQPITPFGVPHRVMADDVYNGMHIPKGAMVFANTQSMVWDENKFHSPQQFKPERFLPKPEGAGEELNMSTIFGWGRRICPGRYLAEKSLWSAAAKILAVFAISAREGGGTGASKPEITFKTILTRHTEPFECDILPRDEKARALILNSGLH
ncbi:cytochrome P450 [Irpex lacteus]|nr:cytochrome P450 [Irpex lacteus]